MTDLTRRAFLRTSGVVGGGLIVGCAGSRGPERASRTAGTRSDAAAFDAWLQITEDDRIVLQLDKVEMGQGTMTGYATIVAEELEVDPTRIEVRAAPVCDDFQEPLQLTGESNSMSTRFEPLRRSAAAARERLRRAGGERLGVDPGSLVIEDGVVRDPASGRSLRYGDLALAAAALSGPCDPPPKPASEFRRIGRDFPRLDAAAKSRGEARFGIDAHVPDLRTAVVVRCPHLRGKLRSFDASRALGMPGVEGVFEISTGVAVVADRYWRARRAADALGVEWDPGESAGVSSESIRAEQRRRLEREFGSPSRGGVGRAAARGARVLEADYFAPYLAHAAMEPLNCTVVPGEGRCDVYCGTQAPDVAREYAADVMGLPRERVFVHNAFLGGGFGRRYFPDYVREAAEVAREAGAPVKVVWSREDDTRHDFYRPASSHRLRAALDEGGAPVGWEHGVVVSAILPYVVEGFVGTFAPEWLRGAASAAAPRLAGAATRLAGPLTASQGAADLPYAVGKAEFGVHAWDAGIPVGLWRSVGHSQNAFVIECFLDEIAAATGRDPVALRRALLAERPRHLAALELAAAKAPWGEVSEGRFQGVAVHESYGTVVAQVAEVSVGDGGRIRVHRVVCAVDCGIAINPDIVRAQMESGIAFGLTAALHGEIRFVDGAAQQGNFHDQPLLRMDEAPAIETHIVASDAPPTGVGEPGTPPIAPAVANAVFAATGQRLRELPLRLAPAR